MTNLPKLSKSLKLLTFSDEPVLLACGEVNSFDLADIDLENLGEPCMRINNACC